MVAPTEESEQVQHTHSGPSVSRLAEDVSRLFAEFKEYTGYLVSLELDRAKLALKRSAVIAVLGGIALTILVAALATGAGLFLIGCAGLLGLAFGNFWLGAAVVGIAVMALPTGGLVGAWFLYRKSILKSLRLKYAQRREHQKQKFQRDIQEVAHG